MIFKIKCLIKKDWKITKLSSFIKVVGRMGWRMVRIVSFIGMTVMYILVNFRWGKCMAREFWKSAKILFTKANGRKANNMDMEHTPGRLAINMLDNGKMGINMAKLKYFLKLVILIKHSLKMTLKLEQFYLLKMDNQLHQRIGKERK
jgi:hypothetical protein